jgi:dTDP-4-dehydrorhamnose reductase
MISGECFWCEFACRVFKFLGLGSDFGPTTTAEYGARAHRPAYSVLAREELKHLGLDNMRPCAVLNKLGLRGYDGEG